MRFLSVVIPTRNRLGLLEQCVKRLTEQTLDAASYEIIVVDDGSEEPVPVPLLPGSEVEIRTIRQLTKGPAAARNRGVAAASGETVVFIGDDILAPSNFLELHLTWHRSHPSHWEGMLGRVTWPSAFLEDPYMRWLDRSGLQFGFEGLKPGQQLRYYHFYTSNLSVKRRLLLEHRFDEDFRDASHEDTDLGLRLHQAGFQLYYEPRCVAEHHHHYTLEDSCRHRRRVGRAGYLFEQKHPKEANFRWIRRPWLPLRALLSTRLYQKVATLAQRAGDLTLMGFYYYFRNSEAFWEGFSEAAAEHSKRRYSTAR